MTSISAHTLVQMPAHGDTSGTGRQNPYVGPRTFTREDAKLFFGRERESRDLLDLVISERLVLFYAQSGAGKSSLINTRLIPQLQVEGYTVLPVGRVSGALPANVAQVDNIFLFNLMLSLDQTRGDPARFAQMPLNDFLGRLTSDDGQQWYYDEHSTGGGGAAGNSLMVAAGNGQATVNPCILIVDQFEEIITHHPDRWRDRAGFFQQMNQAMLTDRSLWIVLTLREDYVAALDPYAPHMEDRLRARYYMQRMGYQAALEAICKPAAAFKRPFAPDAAATLADNLRRVQVAGGIGDEPGGLASSTGAAVVAPTTILGETIEPVQLQVVCFQLWERLAHKEAGVADSAGISAQITVADVAAYGDVDSALTDFYEETIAGVLQTVRAATGTAVTERQMRDWFSRQLITEAETRGLVYQGETATGGLPNTMVEELQKHFLVRAEVRGGGAWIELVHDRFVGPILAANRNWMLKNLSPLTQAAESWRAGDKRNALLLNAAQFHEAQKQLEADPEAYGDLEREFVEASRVVLERQAAQRQRLMLTGAGLLLLVLVVLTTWALLNAKSAQDNANTAHDEALAAQLARTQAEDEKVRADQEKERADQEKVRAAALADEAARARAGQLAVQAQAALDKYAAPEGLLLAVEAITATWALSDTPGATHVVDVDRVLQQGLLSAGASPQLVHGGQLYDVAFSPDGHWLASGGTDGTIRLWNVNDPGTAPSVLTGHTGTVFDVAFSPDGKYLASASADNTVGLWSAGGTEQPVFLRGHTAGVARVAFSPDSRQLASASSDKTVRVWSVVDPERASLVLTGNTGRVNSVVFDADGTLLASAGDDNSVRIWHLDNAEAKPRVLPHDGKVTNVAFSPDGRWLASASWDKMVRLWPLRDPGGAPVVLSGHNGYVWNVVFSQHGNWLASAGDDGVVLLWSVDNLRKDPVRLTQPDSVFDVAFSPDGLWVVAAGKGGSVRLWSMQNLRADPIELRSHTDIIYSANFSANSQWLASASFDGTARLYPLDPERVVALACAKAGRNFTIDEWERYLGSAPYERTCPSWPVEPSVVAAARTKANLLAESGRLPEAIEQFRQVLALDPTSALKPEAEARKLFNRALARQLITEAQALAAQLDVTGAAARYRQALAHDPELEIDPQAEAGRIAAEQLVLQGNDLAQKLDLEGAIAKFERAVNLVPTLAISPTAEATRLAAESLTSQGREAARAGKRDAAVASFQKAAAINPSLAIDPQLETQVEYGRGLLNRYRPLDALAALSASQAISPTFDITGTLDANQWDYICRGGSLANAAGTVLPACERAVAQTSGYGPYHSNRGIARALQGDLTGAIQDLQAYVVWAESNYESEPLIVGRKGWIAALEAGLNPVAANVLTLNGHYKEASPIYARMRALDPPILLAPDEMNNLCWYGTLAGNAQQVLYACDWALMLRGQDANFLDSRGLARAAAGDLQGASRDFQNYLTRSQIPVPEAIRTRRLAWIAALDAGYNPVQAFILTRNGQIDAALALYAQIDSANPPLSLPADQWNNLCWFGSLRGRARDVLFACDRAVELEPTEWNYRDSRGLARALLRDFKGAREDIAFAVAHASQANETPMFLSKRTLVLLALDALDKVQTLPWIK